jgi:hypothetical protein
MVNVKEDPPYANRVPGGLILPRGPAVAVTAKSAITVGSGVGVAEAAYRSFEELRLANKKRIRIDPTIK